MIYNRKFIAFISFLTISTILGCGSSEVKRLDMGGDEGDKISSLIEELNEAVGNPKKLEAFFVKGSIPSEPKRMAKFSYSIIGKPSVNGTTGSVKVRIDPIGGGQSHEEKEWVLEKVGEKWKIKSAPTS